MRLSERYENGRRVRIVEWSAGSPTDLGVVTYFLAVTVVGLVAILCAVETSSWVRGIFVALAVLSALVWVMLVGSFLVFHVVVGAVRAHRFTALANALVAVACAGVGGAIGVGTYEAGPGALVYGPLFAALVVAVVWSRFSSRSARVRLLLFACLGAAASAGVGATILL